MPSITELAAKPQQVSFNRYGYTPTLWICILYLTLFSLSTIIHLGQAIRYRLWFLICTVCICGVLEIVGWSARLQSHFGDGVTLYTPYVTQLCTTVLAPTPLVAANFVILGQIISRLGQQYSRLSAKWYTIIFVSCDFVALVIQALGGAVASTAASKNTDPRPGSNLMLAGIVFQLVAITVYMLLAAEFILRSVYDRPIKAGDSNGRRNADMDRKMKAMLAALAISSVCIYIRSYYRTIELADGWTGVVIRTQWLFNVFDAAMIVIAMVTINVLHPGLLLGTASTWSQYKSRGGAQDDTLRSSEEGAVDKKDSRPSS